MRARKLLQGHEVSPGQSEWAWKTEARAIPPPRPLPSTASSRDGSRHGVMVRRAQRGQVSLVRPSIHGGGAQSRGRAQLPLGMRVKLLTPLQVREASQEILL